MTHKLNKDVPARVWFTYEGTKAKFDLFYPEFGFRDPRWIRPDTPLHLRTNYILAGCLYSLAAYIGGAEAFVYCGGALVSTGSAYMIGPPWNIVG